MTHKIQSVAITYWDKKRFLIHQNAEVFYVSAHINTGKHIANGRDRVVRVKGQESHL